MSSLRATLHQLAEQFADAVVAAIRSASLEDLMAEQVGTPRRAAGRPAPARRRRAAATVSAPAPVAPPKAKLRGGRLARRSAADIERVLASIVQLVKPKKDGMRSEEIRKALGLDVREMPRVLRHGVATKKLRARGQKRATTYSAA